MNISAIISHVEFCPMFDVGDYCIDCYFADARYFAVYRALVGMSATRDKVFGDPASALHYMVTNQTFCSARLWYNGCEALQEIRSAEDILLAANGHYDKTLLLSFALRLGLTERQACEAIWRLPLRR